MVMVERSYGRGRFGQMHMRMVRPTLPASAPPLLCLHQSPKSGRDYEALITHLGETRLCLAPDTPGYGASDAPDTPPSIADYGHAMLDFLADQQTQNLIPHGPVDIMGYHTGSAIAAWLARHHPDRIRRVILVSLPAFDKATRTSILENFGIFPAPQRDGSHLQKLWDLGESLNDARHDAEWRSVALGDALQSGNRFAWGFRAVFSHDVIADLAAISQPVLLICPNDDLRDQTLAHRHVLQNMTWLDLPNSGNGFLHLDSQAIAAQIAAYLGG